MSNASTQEHMALGSAPTPAFFAVNIRKQNTPVLRAGGVQIAIYALRRVFADGRMFSR